MSETDVSMSDPWSILPFWEDPPSTGLQPFAADAETILAALKYFEFELAYVVSGATLVADRSVQVVRLEQVRTLIAALDVPT